MAGNIVAIGGWPWGETDEVRRLQDLILELAPGRRVLYVPTAGGEDAETTLEMYEAWRGRADLTHLSFFPWPPEDLRGFTLDHDAIVVGGGNTANMLAIWRVHGFDAVLREAWERGIALAGWSAGMICWFEAGVTDSFGPQLGGMRDGLRFLPGSACPHYDGEERRRPVYQRLVADGFPPGFAADDSVALHFAGTELAGTLTARAGAGAYRVEAGREDPLDARLLS